MEKQATRFWWPAQSDLKCNSLVSVDYLKKFWGPM